MPNKIQKTYLIIETILYLALYGCSIFFISHGPLSAFLYLLFGIVPFILFMNLLYFVIFFIIGEFDKFCKTRLFIVLFILTVLILSPVLFGVILLIPIFSIFNIITPNHRNLVKRS